MKKELSTEKKLEYMSMDSIKLILLMEDEHIPEEDKMFMGGILNELIPDEDMLSRVCEAVCYEE